MTAPIEADKELDEILHRVWVGGVENGYLYGTKADFVQGEAQTALLAWRDRAEKRAYKQGWDSAGGEAMEETHRKEVAEAVVAELEELNNKVGDLSKASPHLINAAGSMLILSVRNRLSQLGAKDEPQ